MIQTLLQAGRRVRLAFRRGAAERSMDTELRHHIECEIEERVRGGMSPEDARRAALAAFGSVEVVKELSRDARGTRSLEDLGFDLRFGARQLLRQPAFTIAAVLTLALGVGAVTAVYSLVYGMLLRPLPYDQPDRLVVLWERNVPRDRDQNVVSLENFEAWRDRASSFLAMSALVPASVTLDGEPIAERLVGADVTAGYFSLLGVRPAIGRDFDDEDAKSGAAVILSNELWTRRFGADPAVVGRAVVLSGRPFTVVGVMPAGFDPPRIGWLGEQELWFPFVVTPQARAWGRFLIVVARLREGITVAQAGAEMAAIAAQRGRESPANAEWSATVRPLAEQIVGDVETPLLVLMSAVVLLLAMATANVATLSLSMVGRRTQELAVRRAIGATDRRLFRQLFVQGAMVGTAGAGAGAVMAVPAVRGLLALLPPGMPRAASVALDGPVLLATTIVALAAAALLGGVAAARGCRLAGSSPLSRVDAGGRVSGRIGGGGLVVGEIALAVALGIMALLMARTFASLRSVDLGFEPSGVLVARVALPGAAYGTPARQRAFFDELTERARQIPGATGAAIISSRPFGGAGPATVARDAARPPAADGQDPVVDVRYVDASLFSTLGIGMAAGAPFDASDAVRGEPRVIISSSLAQQLWPAGDAVGRQLAIGMYGGIVPMVAAVVDDIHLIDARTPARPAAYLPAARYPANVRDVVVRLDGEPGHAVPELRRAVAAIDPAATLYAVTTMPDVVEAALATDRLTTALLVAFACVALALAVVGVFGVFAGDVARRRREIGIRLALGAVNGSILRLLLLTSLRRASLGLAGGWLLGAVLGRTMESLLFGVAGTDPLTFVSIGVLAVVLAGAATMLPAWQALRASPLRSLREQ